MENKVLKVFVKHDKKEQDNTMNTWLKWQLSNLQEMIRTSKLRVIINQFIDVLTLSDL